MIAKKFASVQNTWWIISHTLYPTIFNSLVFRLQENAFASQNIDSRRFYPSIHSRQNCLPSTYHYPPGLIQIHMAAIKLKHSEVVYTYQVTTKQTFMCKIVLLCELWLLFFCSALKLFQIIKSHFIHFLCCWLIWLVSWFALMLLFKIKISYISYLIGSFVYIYIALKPSILPTLFKLLLLLFIDLFKTD